MGDKAKKQHYVPQMYLKHFADKDRKCYTLNSKGEIHSQRIKEICKKKNIYEFKNKHGEIFLNNHMEKVFFYELETVFSPFLDELFKTLDNLKRISSIKNIPENDKACLLGFIVFLFLRNPCVLDATKEVTENMGMALTDREAHNVGILNTALLLDNRIRYFAENYAILIHRNYTKTPFITSNIPVSIMPLSGEVWFWYLPFSARYLVALIPKKVSAFSDVLITDIDEENVDYLNKHHWLFCSKLTDEVLISSDEELLKRYRKEFYE